MLEIFNFYFSNKYIVEIWLIFSLLLSSFILFYNGKIKLVKENHRTFNTKINYYMLLFFISILLSFWDPIFFYYSKNFNDTGVGITFIEACLGLFTFMSWFKIFFLFLSIYFYYLLKIYINIIKKVFDVELLILLSFSILGLFLILSSPDFIWFYLSLELYSLSIYSFLFIFGYSYINSSIKYFIVGSVSSLLLLFSITVIYFYTGTFNMESLELFFSTFNFLDTMGNPVPSLRKNFFLIFGLGLFLISFGLKLGLAPLHVWSIDVYSNQSFYSTFFLLVLPKLTFITFLINFFYSIVPSLMQNEIFYYIILVFSILSVLVGTLGIINQTNIKKIFLYSSLGNMIFLLMPLMNPSHEVLSNYIVFSFFYFVNLIALLTIFICLKDSSNQNPIKKIDHLCSLYKSHPYLACLLTFCLLSLSGIPPFIGFYTKFYFLQTLFSMSIILFLIVIISNSIMFYYSIKIIKLMFFNNNKRISFSPNISWKFCSLVIIIIILLNILSIFYISFLYALSYSLSFI